MDVAALSENSAVSIGLVVIFIGALGAIGLAWHRMTIELVKMRSEIHGLKRGIKEAADCRITHESMLQWRELFQAKNPTIIVPDIP